MTEWLNETFLNPERLWWLLLIPALIVFYLWAQRRRGRLGMRFTNTAVMDAVMPRQSPWRRHVAVIMTLISLIAVVTAWARPSGIEKVPRERATIVLVIDISRSMESKDVKPTRLAAAQEQSVQFLQQVPPKYNVAVVSLAGKPTLVVPPTVDRAMTRRAIEALKPADGTAIGEGLYAALEAVKAAPANEDGTIAPGAVILLSDGTNQSGRPPADAATELKTNKIPVYTIAYGTPNGSVDLDGKRHRVTPDTELMKTLATSTGGEAWTARNADQLNKVYDNIASSVGHEEVRTETTATWAGYALGFAVVAALGAVSLGARWP